MSYTPFDISADAISAGASRLAERYTDIRIDGVVGDLDHHLDTIPTGGRRLFALLGGTIGNYRPKERRLLLAEMADTMSADDLLLLGTDLVKERKRLVDAYDDPAGVTAAFNPNVISVISRMLGLRIDPQSFRHRAIWNPVDEWIEMLLVATETVVFELESATMTLDPGEYLLIEISAKFTPERLAGDLEAGGLRLLDTWRMVTTC